jgi:hypothetical protein
MTNLLNEILPACACLFLKNDPKYDQPQTWLLYRHNGIWGEDDRQHDPHAGKISFNKLVI